MLLPRSLGRGPGSYLLAQTMLVCPNCVVCVSGIICVLERDEHHEHLIISDTGQNVFMF